MADLDLFSRHRLLEFSIAAIRRLCARNSPHQWNRTPGPADVGTVHVSLIREPCHIHRSSKHSSAKTWGRKPHPAILMLGRLKLLARTHVGSQICNWLRLDRELIASSAVTRLTPVCPNLLLDRSALEANCPRSPIRFCSSLVSTDKTSSSIKLSVVVSQSLLLSITTETTSCTATNLC